MCVVSETVIALRAKQESLFEAIAGAGPLLVAYSGGTDSAYLAWAARRVLGGAMLAVIADSASLPRAELAAALAFAERHGIPVEVLRTEELSNPAYARNAGDRCFHCKDELFARMEELRAARGFAHLAYGMNVDDRGDHRPGQRAAVERHVLAPLAAAGLTKAEIRELAREAGLELADKPASACLASRIEYGRPVTVEALRQVEEAEAALHALGLRQVRVRHHGELARVEIAREELAQALTMEMFRAMSEHLRPLGFKYVAVDVEGYRSGSMNAVLPVESLTAAQ
jgi:uncharacterized protein